MTLPAIVLLDIDGCLLPQGRALADLEALRRFKRLAARLPIGFCTGRPQPFVDALSRIYPITAPSICEWGGVIFLPESYRTLINPSLSSAYLSRLQQVIGNLYMLGLNIQPKTTALTVYSDPDQTMDTLEKLVATELIANDLYSSMIVSSAIDHIDVRSSAITKAVGLTWLIETNKEAYSSVFVIGDDETDLELFHRADYSAAPNNACDVVKSAANFVSPECGTIGVCQILEEILRFAS